MDQIFDEVVRSGDGKREWPRCRGIRLSGARCEGRGDREGGFCDECVPYSEWERAEADAVYEAGVGAGPDGESCA